MARVYGVTETEMETLLEDEATVIRAIEKDYDANERPKLREGLQAFKNEFPEYERREMRRRYLLSRIEEMKPFLNNPLVEKELKRLMMEVKIYTGKVKGISPEMIERARDYPIADLIEHRGFLAKCPFHDDKTPSLNIRNNFYYCHGCSANGNAIDFLMKRDGVDFKTAVDALQ